MKRVELLAPAGSFDALKAAVNNGADAVYLGGANFSARAFADNFDYPRMKEAVEYCHLRNVRVFVTMNTLLNEFEIENAIKDARYYHEIGVDALLIQDLGFYYLLSKELPTMEIHASTQMHIHDLDGVRSARKMGFKRVVVARESSLDFIKEACKEDVEIECFVHGAICVSYSGQCLLSSSTKNRSANKGICAQCCRLRYQLENNGKRVDTDTEYLLSPKDMCLLEDLPDLLDAGVSCLKIEGRMKSPAYVAYVTRLYREAIDSYYDKKKFRLDEQRMIRLKKLFNRGFTDTYLKNDDSDLFGNLHPNHMGVRIGKVMSVRKGIATVSLDRDLNQFDGIRIVGSTNECGLIVNRLYKKGLLVSSAKAGDIIGVEVKEYIDKDSDVLMTLDSTLEKEILDYELKRIPVSLDISIKAGSRPIIRCSVDNHHYTYVGEFDVQAALNRPLDAETVIRQFSKCKDTVYSIEKISADTRDSFLPVSSLNALRRSFFEFLDKKRLELRREFSFVAPVTNTAEEAVILDKAVVSNVTDGYYIEPVIRDHEFEIRDKMIISTVGGLFTPCAHKIAGYTMNVSNSWAIEFLLCNGFENVVISSELDVYGIAAMVSSFRNRTGIEFKPYMFVKGRRVLMYTRRDPIEKYRDQEGEYILNDGINRLEIIRKGDHSELSESYENPLFDEVSGICNCLYIEDGNLL